jgi:hypothetical protein
MQIGTQLGSYEITAFIAVAYSLESSLWRFRPKK